MSVDTRPAKVQALADKAEAMGFSTYIILCWDPDGRWALTVNPGIDPQRLRDAAMFLAETAKGDHHG